MEKILPKKIKPEKARGLDLSVQMNVTGPEGGNWIVTVKDQQIEVKRGVHPSPSISVKIADHDLVDLVNGELGAVQAFMSGKFEFKGNMSDALRLMDLGVL